MGLILETARYTIDICKRFAKGGKVLTCGRLDVLISLDQYAALMVNAGLATVEKEQLRFLNPPVHARVEKLASEQGLMEPARLHPTVVPFQCISAKLFFLGLGFEQVDSVDVDGHEGATHIFDMYDEDITRVIPDKYDLVLDSGIMEHILDVRRVFRHLTDVTRVGGLLLHTQIGNNCFDHGFFQLSPTLFNDYYLKNRYEVLDISVLELQQNSFARPDDPFVIRFDQGRYWPYDPAKMAPRSFGPFSNSIYYSLCCARKTEASLRDQMPTQWVFQKR